MSPSIPLATPFHAQGNLTRHVLQHRMQACSLSDISSVFGADGIRSVLPLLPCQASWECQQLSSLQLKSTPYVLQSHHSWFSAAVQPFPESQPQTLSRKGLPEVCFSLLVSSDMWSVLRTEPLKVTIHKNSSYAKQHQSFADVPLFLIRLNSRQCLAMSAFQLFLFDNCFLTAWI